MPPTRRSFLKGGLGALGASVFPGCERETSPVGTRSLSLGGDVPWGGAIVGAPADAGHLVRQSRFPSPTQHRRTRVAIVGGGISALSAAWWLNRHSFKDFLLFELDVVPGGNARSGHNQHGNHPWGAHYVPIPNQEATYVQELLYDVGVITDFDEEGKPNYDDLYVCHAPEERLYIHGVWQDGLVPVIGISKEDERQYRAFFSLIDELRYRRGGDGKPAFAVPIHFSSADTEFTALDKCSFHQYLNERSFTSTPLRWYLDYCCRDDFGASSRDVSAWAGLHYFAGRRPLSSIPLDSNLLTWPEGNGWIANQLSHRLRDQITTRAVVFQIVDREAAVELRYFDRAQQCTVAVTADYVLYAAPRFTIPYVIPALADYHESLRQLCHYSPWMVANLTLETARIPDGSRMAWDNVIYQGQGIGYVNANHQLLTAAHTTTILTYYMPLSEEPPGLARQGMGNTTYEAWCEAIFRDLRGPHPGLEKAVQHLDVWLWGHGMICPTPSYIWGGGREVLPTQVGRIFFAHSDQSGLSLFEEAQWQGVERAKSLLQLVAE